MLDHLSSHELLQENPQFLDEAMDPVGPDSDRVKLADCKPGLERVEPRHYVLTAPLNPVLVPAEGSLRRLLNVEMAVYMAVQEEINFSPLIFLLAPLRVAQVSGDVLLRECGIGLFPLPSLLLKEGLVDLNLPKDCIREFLYVEPAEYSRVADFLVETAQDLLVGQRFRLGGLVCFKRTSPYALAGTAHPDLLLHAQG